MTAMFNAALALYLAALVASVVAIVGKRRSASVVCIALMYLGSVIQVAYMTTRWLEAGRAPFSNMFESLVLFAWAMVVVCMVIYARVRVPVLNAATALMASLTLAYASTFESDIAPLVPALQSNWLSVHVFSCFLGYGGFAVSFLAAIAFLISRARGANDSACEALEDVVAKTVSFGFLWLTIGIITGAVWANSAWGTYWSWDPKETWSLVTWFIYAGFLHCRFVRGWRGRRAAWVAILGFLSVLFTYFGVNFLLSGLHSYGSGDS
jgi:ABC-type transport system involved in cytochrome c biogenesis permease subunit